MLATGETIEEYPDDVVEPNACLGEVVALVTPDLFVSLVTPDLFVSEVHHAGLQPVELARKADGYTGSTRTVGK